MKINNLMSLALIISGFTMANSAHAMLMRHTINRSGTKYVAQLAQKTQKRFRYARDAEGKMDSRFIYSNDAERMATSLDNIANELKKSNTNMESLLKKVDSFEKTKSDAERLVKSYMIGYAGGLVIVGGVGIAAVKFDWIK